MSIKKKILKPFMKTLKNDLEIIRKRAKIRKRRRPYPKMKSKSTGKWIYFKSPDVIYFGGAIHWVGKDGKIKHSGNKTVEEAEKEKMTKAEFKKRFYNPEVMKKMMKDG